MNMIEHVQRYIALKRHLGCKYRNNEYVSGSRDGWARGGATHECARRRGVRFPRSLAAPVAHAVRWRV